MNTNWLSTCGPLINTAIIPIKITNLVYPLSPCTKSLKPYFESINIFIDNKNKNTCIAFVNIIDTISLSINVLAYFKLIPPKMLIIKTMYIY